MAFHEETKRKAAVAWLAVIITLALAVAAVAVATAAVHAEPLEQGVAVHAVTPEDFSGFSVSCGKQTACTTPALTIGADAGILVLLGTSAAAGIIFSDSKTDSFTQLNSSHLCQDGSQDHVTAYVAASPAGGSTTFNVTDSAGFFSLYVVQLPNAAFDVAGTIFGTCYPGGASTISATITPHGVGDFLGFVATFDANSLWATTAPSTELGTYVNSGTRGTAAAFYNTTTTSPTTISGTTSTNPGDVPQLDEYASVIVDVPSIPHFACTVEAPAFVEAQFTAYVNVSDGAEPYQYTINWADGSSNTVIDSASAAVTHTHTYTPTWAENGDYLTINVTVDDVTPATAYCTFIIEEYVPVAFNTLTYLPDAPTANASVYFTANVSAGAGLYYENWSWDDGNYTNYSYSALPTNLTIPNHLYTATGHYTVSVTAEDYLGVMVTKAVTFTVGAEVHSGPPPMCQNCGHSVFESISQFIATNYLWIILIGVIMAALAAVAVSFHGSNRRHSPPRNGGTRR